MAAPNDSRYKLVPNPSGHSLNTANSNTSNNSLPKNTIPRIPLNPSDHKLGIAIPATIIVFFNSILPVGLYYILKDAAHLKYNYVILVTTLVFGAPSILTLFTRTWSLMRPKSTTRPIGGSKRHLDYFHYNFLTIFVIITVMIAVGSSLSGSTDPNTVKIALRIVSMGLSIIITIVCTELVVVSIIMTVAPSYKYPFRFSSMTAGTVMRPASYTIIEDVVAVDCKQGTSFRRVFNERYQFSKEVRGLLRWVDAAWGFTGLAVTSGIFVTIWVVDNVNIGFFVGWLAPWVWISIMTLLTITKTKATLRKERVNHLMA